MDKLLVTMAVGGQKCNSKQKLKKTGIFPSASVVESDRNKVINSHKGIQVLKGIRNGCVELKRSNVVLVSFLFYLFIFFFPDKSIVHECKRQIHVAPSLSKNVNCLFVS